MYDLIIIGGGPAGLAASVYAARKRLNTLLITVNIGGQINTTWGIENYLGYQFIEGPELISKFEAQVKQFPIDQKIGSRVTFIRKIEGGLEVTADSGEKHQGKAVIFATGKNPKKLNVPGEKEFAGKGVSYCAVCDGPVFAGQKVAVVGGGNSAVTAALDMVKIAEYVNLVSLTKLTADPVLIDKLGEAKNLAVYPEHQTLSIKGNQFVEGVVAKDVKSGAEKQLAVTVSSSKSAWCPTRMRSRVCSSSISGVKCPFPVTPRPRCPGFMPPAMSPMCPKSRLSSPQGRELRRRCKPIVIYNA